MTYLTVYHHSLCYLFADDTKCLKVISNLTDLQSLQEDLDNSSNWSHTNKLLFNESKLAHLHFGKKVGSHTYSLNGSNITTEIVSRIWEYTYQLISALDITKR